MSSGPVSGSGSVTERRPTRPSLPGSGVCQQQAVEEQDPGGGGRQVVGERGLGEQQRRRGVPEHERDPVRRVAGIDGQVRGAGLEHPEQGGDQLKRAVRADRDERAWAGPWARSVCATRLAAAFSSR